MGLFTIPADVDVNHLRLYMQRTQQTHVKTRVLSTIITAFILLFTLGVWIIIPTAIWVAAIIGTEVFYDRSIRRYQAELQAPDPEKTQRITRSIVSTAATLGAIYSSMGLALAFLPTPGPAIGSVLSILVLMNIAGQHVLWSRMFFWTIPIPALTLIVAASGIGAGAVLIILLVLVQTISLNQASVKFYSSLTIAHIDAQVQSAARVHADAANSAKSQFIATMSHELRTPLNAIIGYSELMREDATAASRSQDMHDHDKVLGSATRLLRLINDVLDVSKIEAGSMTCEAVTFSVKDETLCACETVRRAIEANGNDLNIIIDPTLGHVESDSFRFGQCLLNLLSNAAKFTNNGTVIVNAWRGIDASAGQICVSVSDTGLGMTEGQMAALFQPFTQGDNSITRQFGGTGLGLSLSRSLARLMGGDIVVTSKISEGSCFTLSITPQKIWDDVASDAPAPDASLRHAA